MRRDLYAHAGLVRRLESRHHTSSETGREAVALQREEE